MSLITKNNYEAYLLDYVEENLSPELIAELMLFFENNPELKENLEDFEIHELVPADIILPEMNDLIRDDSLINLNNYEAFIIAEIEGENSVEESHHLELFIQVNPNLKKELLAYEKTRLVGETILFEDKKTLLQKDRKVIPLYWWTSAAAAVIVGLFLVNGLNSNPKQEYFPLAGRYTSILESEEKEGSLNFFVFESETKQLAEIDKHISILNKKLKKSNESKIQKNQPAEKAVEEFTPEPLNDASLAETLSDTLNNNTDEVQNDVIPENEPVLYAENSVKIVYEDEVLDNGTPTPEKKKMTKLEIIREVIKKQVKAKVLDKGRDGMLIAKNSKPANFIREMNK